MNPAQGGKSAGEKVIQASPASLHRGPADGFGFQPASIHGKHNLMVPRECPPA